MKKNQTTKSGASTTRRAITSTTAPAAPQQQPQATAPAQEPPPAPQSLPQIDVEQRREARSWGADRVIEELKRVTQGAYSRAGLIGRWVWVHFSEAPAPEIRAALSQLGFHWSARRQCWQHPCGYFATGRGGDPAGKYGVHYV
jgi:hypothetical protein